MIITEAGKKNRKIELIKSETKNSFVVDEIAELIFSDDGIEIVFTNGKKHTSTQKDFFKAIKEYKDGNKVSSTVSAVGNSLPYDWIYYGAWARQNELKNGDINE